jgi:hypothetical protein
VPIITITRGSLSASAKLTDRLTKELHCREISREDLIEHGKQYGIDEFMNAARKIMESKPPASWDPHAAQIRHFLTIGKAALMDLVVQGDVVYHGLQTHFVLNDIPRVFKIKVVAPLEYRVRNLVRESEMSENAAREHILFVDEMRVSWAKFLYGENFDDPTHYDLILNMSHLNLDAMAQVIAYVVQRPEFRIDAGAMKAIRDAHLKALVMAYLVRSEDTRDMELTADCDSTKGLVKIHADSSAVSVSEWEKKIEAALSNLKLINKLEISE